MKTLSILLVAASLSTLATAAFAQPSDSVEANIDRQIVLGNVKASNDSVTQSQGIVEGRQAAHVTDSSLPGAEQYIIGHMVASDGN
ncbi:MAG: hypothetical protein P4L82_05565 [Ancalomicrobiaceae bacterium]|nr:hypothetical protein [Ancalomicrobiaceae bacterium]